MNLNLNRIMNRVMNRFMNRIKNRGISAELSRVQARRFKTDFKIGRWRAKKGSSKKSVAIPANVVPWEPVPTPVNSEDASCEDDEEEDGDDEFEAEPPAIVNADEAKKKDEYEEEELEEVLPEDLQVACTPVDEPTGGLLPPRTPSPLDLGMSALEAQQQEEAFILQFMVFD